MEIIFENKTAFTYKDLCYKIQCVRDSVDSVVPDVNEDIGRVASVQHCILLKSKDITERGVSIGGEIKLCALYITENEDKVSALNLSKTFNIDFDVPEISADAVAQIKLNLNNIESRIINPRKLAVNYEICGLLSVYTPEECDIESVVPEKDSTLLKQKTETVEIDLPCAVCEKSLIINEQHVLSSIKTNPVRLISADAKLVCGECQHVGTKLIVKGTAYITVTYITENENYPLITEFSANFSQILDTGVENIVHCAVRPELNNLYYELKETINGEYAVDIELHAVLQAACYKTQCLKYISDAYSNKMPLKINSLKCFKTGNSRLQYEKINIDEKLSVSHDCQDILCVLPSLCHAPL